MTAGCCVSQTTPAGPRAATGIVLNGGTGASLGSRTASRKSSVAASSDSFHEMRRALPTRQMPITQQFGASSFRPAAACLSKGYPVSRLRRHQRARRAECAVLFTSAGAVSQLPGDPGEIYRALVEHALEAMSVVDDRGLILYENLFTERFLDHKRSERQGLSFIQFVHPDDAARVGVAFEQTLMDLDASPFIEFRMRGPE